jgi:hypothetical protein
MMKLFVRFLLSFSLFLLGGYAHTALVPRACGINYSPKSNIESAAQAEQATMQSTPACYRQAPASGTENINDLFIDREAEDDSDDDDDDESTHSKKSSGAHHDGIHFLKQASADSYHSLTGSLPFCEHFSGLKFMLHCVIRI